MHESKVKYKKIFETLGVKIDDFDDESIYEFAPVFKGNDRDGQSIIVKRTAQNPQRARCLARWTKALSSSGVKVVTPVEGLALNPIEVDSEMWVAYPFVKGRSYNGSKDDISESGKLLAMLHSVANEDFGFKFFQWDDYGDEFFNGLNDDLNLVEQFCSDRDIAAGKYFCDRLRSQIYGQLKRLKSKQLPLANSSWDFKANNLIFDNIGSPVLVDPDNAGRIPRILDLALAFVLFHNESVGSPPRPFNSHEWDIFRYAYCQHSKFTEVEREAWQEILNFVILDEALWAVVDNIKDGWDTKSPHQRAFIEAILAFNPLRYFL